MDDHGGVVDAVVVAQRRTDHKDRKQVGRGRHDVQECVRDGVEQRILHQDVLDGVAGKREFGENRQADALVVALPRHLQHRFGVRRGLPDRGVQRARSDADKALAIGGIEVHHCPLSLVTCHKPVTGYQRFVTDTAVLVIDMFNDYRHEDAEKLAPSVSDIIEPVAGLVWAARKRDDVDLIYINDNYGDFTANQEDLVRRALDGERPELVEPIVPQDGARFLQKVRHSAFYATPLAYLLRQLDTKRLILTGQVTEQCILYTALDAYIRHFQVIVPANGVAHIDEELGKAALQMMERNMRATILPAEKCLD